VNIANIDFPRPDADEIAMFLVQCASRSVVVPAVKGEESPELGEGGPEGTGEVAGAVEEASVNCY
jgi:hypothetical protein